MANAYDKSLKELTEDRHGPPVIEGKQRRIIK